VVAPVSLANLTISSTNFTQCASEAIEFGEIKQNKGNYAVQGHSRSFKVTDFNTNRKLIYDFLLVINTNLPPTLHHFRYIAFHRSKWQYVATLLAFLQRTAMLALQALY